jgi:hypothetical protein
MSLATIWDVAAIPTENGRNSLEWAIPLGRLQIQSEEEEDPEDSSSQCKHNDVAGRSVAIGQEAERKYRMVASDFHNDECDEKHESYGEGRIRDGISPAVDWSSNQSVDECSHPSGDGD